MGNDDSPGGEAPRAWAHGAKPPGALLQGGQRLYPQGVFVQQRRRPWEDLAARPPRPQVGPKLPHVPMNFGTLKDWVEQLLGSGHCAGRRIPLLLVCLLSGLVGLVSTTASSFGWLVSWRFLLGMIFGLGTSPWSSTNLALDKVLHNRHLQLLKLSPTSLWLFVSQLSPFV